MSEAAYGSLMEAVFYSKTLFENKRVAYLITELQAASTLGSLHALAAGALPVFVMTKVWEALGSGYLEAKAIVKKEKFAQGYSRGFVMGLLGWEWHHAVNRFGVHGLLRTNHFDESLDVVAAKEFMKALVLGFKVSNSLPDAVKSAFLQGLKRYASPQKGNWSRNDQISYVIELSTAYRKNFMRL